MTKQRAKRAISLVVALVLVVTLLPVVPAMAASVEVSDVVALAKTLAPNGETYDETKVAVDEEANTIQLLADITFDQTEQRPNVNFDVTLDLNGHSLGSTTGATNYSTALIKVIEGGSLTVVDKSGTPSKTGITGALLVDNGGTLTLGNGAVVTKAEDNGIAAVGGVYGSTIKVEGTAALSGAGTLLATTGTMEITGGTFTSTDEAGSNVSTVQLGGEAAKADKPAKGTISGGVINGDVGVFTYGDLTVEDGAVINNKNGFAISTNGSASGENASIGAKITINGGTITGADNACGIYAPAGSWAVKGGKITGGAGIVVRGGDVDVQGGTIEATASAQTEISVGDSGHAVPAAGITVDNAGYPEQAKGQPHVTIGGDATVKAAEGGKTLAACENGTPVEAPAGKVAAEDNPFSVSGGTFTTGTDTADNTNVDQFLAEGYTYTKDQGITYTDEANAEVTLDGVYYETLEKAIAAAGNSSVIELKKNVEIADPIKIESGKPVTINLAGHNITRTGGEARVIQVTNGSLTIEGEGTLTNQATESATKKDLIILSGDNAELTINGGTFEQTIDYGTIFVQSNAKLTVNGGTINGVEGTTTSSTLSVNAGGVLNVTGGTINSDFCAINCFNTATVNISGGIIIADGAEESLGISFGAGTVAEITGTAEVSGVFGVTAKEGAKLTVSGDAKITGTGTDAESGIQVMGTGTTAEIKENAQVSGDYGIYAKDQAQLTVSGGTVTGTAAGIGTNGDDKATPADITVSGGTVSGDIAGVYLPSGKMTVKEEANISGQAGIVQFGGELTVEGGTITANGTADVEIGASGQAVPPAAVATNKQAGYDENVKADLKGGNFAAAEGQPAVTYTEGGESAQPAAGNFTVEGGTYKTGTEADVSVYQYVGSEHAVDPTSGTVGATEGDDAVALAIIDFGYIDKMADVELTEDGKFTSEKGIQYNATAAQWTDATFYWCFNRALKSDEKVEITLTGPNDKTYTDTCEGTSPRYATSFLNPTQLGDDVKENGVVIGDYTISGTVGDDKTPVEAAKGAETAKVNVLPLTPEEMAAYKVTVETAKNGTVAVAENSAPFLQDGESVYFREGDTVTLTVEPAEGYELDTLTVTYGETTEPVEAGDDGAYTFEMPAADVTVKATFKAVEYAVTVKAGENGKVTADKTSATEGAIVTLTVEPAKGYELDTLTVTYGETTEPVEAGDDGAYTFEMPAADVTVKATFEAVKYAVTVETAENGKVTASTDKAEAGDTVTLTVTADKGYELDKISVYTVGDDATAVKVTEAEGKYTFTMPETDVTVKATFKAVKYAVTVKAAQNGKVEADKTYAVKGDTVVLTVTPKDGYEVEKVVYTVGEDTTAFEVTKNAEGKYTFTMPADAVTVSATFKKIPEKTYSVTVKAGENGTASVKGNTVYFAEDDTVTITVAPKDGYEVDEVKGVYGVNKDVKVTTVTANKEYSFKMPAGDVTVTVTFKKTATTPEKKTYEVALAYDNTKGTVTAENKNGKTYYVEGDTVIVTATANEGYEVGTVTLITSSGNSTLTAGTDGKYTFTMPAGDVEVAVEFKEKTVTPTVDTKALEDAIKTAKDIYDVLNDTDIVADGTKPSSVTKGKTVYPQSAVDALAAAIADAEKALANAKTQAEVDAAVEALNKAVADFKAAAIVGTKTTYTGGGSSGGRGSDRGTTTKTNPFGGKVTVETTTDGKTVTVTDKNGQVVAKVVIPAKTPELGYRFEDVPAGHWAEAAIQNMAALKIFQGVSTTRHIFDLNSAVTRGTMAQVLFNLSQGKAGMSNPFADSTGAWYSDAVAWAAAAGVVNGVSDTNFAPNDSITREQLVTMLYRYAQLLALDTNVTADMGKFVDADEVSSWASEAMTWAVGKGLLIGKGAGNLDPTAAASRAEAAVIIDRFLKMV